VSTSDSGDSIDYAQSGVDEPREQAAVARMRQQFARTFGARRGVGEAISDPDNFGSLIKLAGGLGLAISTDGVGTKLMIAQQLRSYREVAYDLVANNVNDVLCMGAEPVGIVDYIGIDVADERFLDEFAAAFSDASIEAGVAVVGGEIAQIGEMLNASHPSPRFDLVATAVGLCRLSAETEGPHPVALNRAGVQPGQILIGLASSGIHSNGLSLARRAVAAGGYALDAAVAALGGRTVGSVLLEPTRLYGRIVLPLLQRGLLRGLANISGGGLLTLARLNPQRSFRVTHLPAAPPIFGFLQEAGRLPARTMFSTFNMGVGMVMAVDQADAHAVLAHLESLGETAMVVGEVGDRTPGEVEVVPARLTGRHDRFEDADA
jgi:phosphoribosylformylglycinamidine cyclo-ligase